MALSPKHKAGTALLAVLLVLTFIWLYSQQRMERLARTVRGVEHTYVVLRAVEQAFSQIAAAEANARGFVLTADQSYARSYAASRAATSARLAVLRLLTADNGSQHARAARLDSLVARRFAVLEQTVRVRQERGFEPAVAIVREQVGRSTTDSIRLLVDEMEQAEEELLTERSASEADGAALVLQVMTLGFLIALGISGMAALVIRRDFGVRTQAARALEEAKEQADEARARAEQASRAKSDFLARMSHELRTPLNSIIGFSNVLLKNRGSALRAQELVYLQRIVANGKHLLALINDILDLSKVEAGRIQLEREPVALDELIADLVAGFEGQLQEREAVSLLADLPRPMTAIVTDAAKLQQVLLNLIGNALKFTERGEVVVRVVVAPVTRAPLRIDVADTGVGIPADRREAVFEAFEQADTGVARRYGGTGLGLAIARSLCVAMGYRLEARENPGGGSVFSVLLAPDGTTDEAGPRRTSQQTPVSLYRVPG